MRLLNLHSSVNCHRNVCHRNVTVMCHRNVVSPQCDRQLGEKSRQFFAKLAHFRECANLRFKGLIVLPLDLKFRLELFHEQV